MKVVLLCGGLGTRLREETEFRPKPMVEIGGRPILWHIMKLYAHSGFREFVLCLGYRGNTIKEYFLNYEAMNNDFTICLGRDSQIQFNNLHTEQGFKVTLADTGQSTMTGGRVKRIQKYIDEDIFLMTYGDGLADLDINQLVRFHQSHGKLATITAVSPTSRFGVLEMNKNRVDELSARSPVPRGMPARGFFVFSRKVFDYLGGDDCTLEREPLNAWPVKAN